LFSSSIPDLLLREAVEAIHKIEVIEGNEIFMQSFRIPLSRSYHDQVLEQVVANRLWDKK
jgi:two-component system LytT family response regulator